MQYLKLFFAFFARMEGYTILTKRDSFAKGGRVQYHGSYSSFCISIEFETLERRRIASDVTTRQTAHYGRNRYTST